MADISVIVSVITPVYNTGAVLLETYKSLKGQSFTEFEWIIVDDGSTDRMTLQILDEIVKSDKSVKVIHHRENKGLPAARNTGISVSKAPYLFFIDGDDLIDPAFIEKAYLVLLQNRTFSFVNSYVIGFGAQDYQWKGGFHEREVFLSENRNTSCFLARREVFSQVDFNESMRDGCEDWDFWLHAASKEFWGYTIPEYLFYYRRSENNKWATLKGKGELAQISKELTKKYEEKLAGNFPRPQLKPYSFGYVSASLERRFHASDGKEKHLLCIFPWLRVGGADQFNLNLLEGLKGKGWQITIVTTLGTEHEWEEKFKEITSDIFHLASLSREFDYSSLLEYLIESRRPGALFLSNSMYGYYVLPYLKLRFPELPVVDYVHCEDKDWYNGGYPYFSSRYTQLLEKTFVTSEDLRNWCLKRGALSEKVSVCYINIDSKKIKRDPENRRQQREKLGLAPGMPLILYVARLTKQKQPGILTKTLAELKRMHAGFKCLVIGDGPDKESLLQDIRKYNLQNDIIYLGSLSNEEVLRYMDAGDIFFLPSLYEGIALSIFEAMAKGLVIIGAEVGGQKELVSEDCGFLIKPSTENEEIQEYTRAFELLLGDSSKMEEMGRCARRRIEKRFQLEAMVDQMNSALMSVKSVKQDTGEVFQQSYLLLLNEMLALKHRNEQLSGQYDTTIIRLVSKYQKQIEKVKWVYHKLKGITNRF